MQHCRFLGHVLARLCEWCHLMLSRVAHWMKNMNLYYVPMCKQQLSIEQPLQMSRISINLISTWRSSHVNDVHSYFTKYSPQDCSLHHNEPGRWQKGAWFSLFLSEFFLTSTTPLIMCIKSSFDRFSRTICFKSRYWLGGNRRGVDWKQIDCSVANDFYSQTGNTLRTC